MNEAKRIALTGASGTGKTTLLKYLEEQLGLPVNPVGSRSVSKAMGFESPYDVDAAGKRAEFQQRLMSEKIAWEAANESFITDRTPFDNLVYTMLHDVKSIDMETIAESIRGTHRYTHVIYCPFSTFCNPGDDVARVKDLAYHRLYDASLWGLIDRYIYDHSVNDGPSFMIMDVDRIEERRKISQRFLQEPRYTLPTHASEVELTS